MTDVTITVEDGLRLTELQGQLSQLQYDLAHVSTTVMSDRILLIVVMIFGTFLALCAVFLFFDSVIGYSGNRPWIDKAYIATNCVVVMLCIAVTVYLWGYMEDKAIVGIESEMANVQGQIDAIRTRYGL